MKQTVLFRFITIGVFVFALSAFAEAEEYDITGKWYVAGVKKPQVSFQYRCWTLRIGKSSSEEFVALSVFRDIQSGETNHASFKLDRQYKKLSYRNQSHDFNGIMTMNGISTVIAVIFSVDEENETAALRQISTDGVQSEYWEELYLTRRSNVTAKEVPLADQMVDHLDCPREY